MNIQTELLSGDQLQTVRFSVLVTGKTPLSDGDKVLSVTAQAFCSRFESMNGEVLAEGSVDFKLLIRKSDGNIVKNVITERFENKEKVAGITPKCMGAGIANALHLTQQTESGWLMLRCEAEVNGYLILPIENEVIRSVEDENVRTREASFCQTKVHRCMPVRFMFQNDLPLSPRMQIPEEIMDVSAFITPEEIHVSGSQLILGGDIFTSMLYRTKEELEPLVQLTEHHRFSQLVDLPSVSEGNGAVSLFAEDASAVLSKDENESYTVSYRIMVSGNAYLYQTGEETVIADAYAIDRSLQTENTSFRATCMGDNMKIQTNQRISLRIPDDKLPVARICSAQLFPSFSEIVLHDGKLEANGSAELSLIYMAAGSGEPEGICQTVPLKLAFAYMGEESDAMAEGSIALTDMQSVLLSGKEVELRTEFSFSGRLYRDETITALTDMQNAEACDYPEFGLIVYRIREDDTLWEVCKKFGIDEQDVISPGSDAQEAFRPGGKLYLFRRLRG